MPHCAVIWCNNQSKNVNKQNSGVSYHKFPNNTYVKDKWIRATGKCNWSPQKHDTVCSEHFEAENFTKKSAKTYLIFDAIPTLKLHPIFDEIDSLYRNTNTIHCTADLPQARRRKKEDRPGLASAKRRKKAHPPDIAPAIRTKEGDPSDIAPAVLIKEEDPSGIAPEIRIKEEDPSGIAPEIRIKEEDPSGITPEIRIKEEDSSGTAPAIRIKEDDPSDLVSANQIKEEDPPDLAPAIRTIEEDPLALVEVTVEVTKVEPANDSQATLANPRESYYTPNNKDSPQTRHLKLSLMTAQETIKRQRLQVKRIRESRRRLALKVAKMENIIKCLREQSANTS